jgi:hypothetical protein
MIAASEFEEKAKNVLTQEYENAKTPVWPGGAIVLAILVVVYGVIQIVKWLIGSGNLLPTHSDIVDIVGFLIFFFVGGHFWDIHQQINRNRNLRLIRVEMKLDALLERQKDIYKTVSDAEMRGRGYV